MHAALHNQRAESGRTFNGDNASMIRHASGTALLLLALVGVPGLLGLGGCAEQEEQPPSFTLAWSIYVGWMPWEYAGAEGIVDRWAERYGIEIDVVQVNDYIESINQYTAGQFDAVTATNMDILSIAAASGVDTTALIVGDYSNGNDAVILRDADDLAAIEDRRVHLVELSVSHYLLARALETEGLSERDLTLVNTADADMVGAWSGGGVPAVVTWNPMVNEILDDPAANAVFDSSMTPGEILDLTLVRTDVLEANPDLGRALVGAWYEIMALMNDAERSDAVLTHMARAAGTDLAGYRRQLETTRLFDTPAAAVEFVTSDAPRTTMERVAEFSFSHGLFGPSAPGPGFVGMTFADGSTWGDADNVNLRFTDRFMRMAAEDAL